MEELIQSINSISEILKGGVPIWVTWFSALSPIILTIVSIIVSCRMSKQNRKLQTMIHSRDVYIQSRKDFLSFYNAFSEGQIVLRKYGPVETVFINEQYTYIWNQEINEAYIEIGKACDKAKLLLDDNAFTDKMISAYQTYQQIRDCVSRYVYNNNFFQVLTDARKAASSQFGMSEYDAVRMMQNTAAREQLIKLCENENTREISRLITNYETAICDDQFELMFKKYLLIQESVED